MQIVEDMRDRKKLKEYFGVTNSAERFPDVMLLLAGLEDADDKAALKEEVINWHVRNREHKATQPSLDVLLGDLNQKYTDAKKQREDAELALENAKGVQQKLEIEKNKAIKAITDNPDYAISKASAEAWNKRQVALEKLRNLYVAFEQAVSEVEKLEEAKKNAFSNDRELQQFQVAINNELQWMQSLPKHEKLFKERSQANKIRSDALETMRVLLDSMREIRAQSLRGGVDFNKSENEKDELLKQLDKLYSEASILEQEASQTIETKNAKIEQFYNSRSKLYNDLKQDRINAEKTRAEYKELEEANGKLATLNGQIRDLEYSLGLGHLGSVASVDGKIDAHHQEKQSAETKYRVFASEIAKLEQKYLLSIQSLPKEIDDAKKASEAASAKETAARNALEARKVLGIKAYELAEYIITDISHRPSPVYKIIATIKEGTLKELSPLFTEKTKKTFTFEDKMNIAAAMAERRMELEKSLKDAEKRVASKDDIRTLDGLYNANIRAGDRANSEHNEQLTTRMFDRAVYQKMKASVKQLISSEKAVDVEKAVKTVGAAMLNCNLEGFAKAYNNLKSNKFKGETVLDLIRNFIFGIAELVGFVERANLVITDVIGYASGVNKANPAHKTTESEVVEKIKNAVSGQKNQQKRVQQGHVAG